MSNKVTVRELKREDIQNGFLQTLDALRQNSSKIVPEKAYAIFEKINPNPYHIVAVAVIDGRVVGTSTLLIESKFIHDGGIAGHIEDVAVRTDLQGKRVGRKIIEYLLEVAKSRGCYKIILDCTDDVKPFYEKLGFRHTGNQLRLDSDDDGDGDGNNSSKP